MSTEIEFPRRAAFAALLITLVPTQALLFAAVCQDGWRAVSIVGSLAHLTFAVLAFITGYSLVGRRWFTPPWALACVALAGMAAFNIVLICCTPAIAPILAGLRH